MFSSLVNESIKTSPVLTQLNALNNETELAALAYALSQYSEHPLAKAIVSYAINHNVDLLAVSDFAVVAGKGVKANVKGRAVMLGSGSWMREMGLTLPQDLIAVPGASVSWLAEKTAQGTTLLGLLCFADKAKAQAKNAVHKLQAAGIQVAMLTGDSAASAEYVAKELGLDNFNAEVLPQGKAQAVAVVARKHNTASLITSGFSDSD
jgi:Cu+-exporting ATPase